MSRLESLSSPGVSDENAAPQHRPGREAHKALGLWSIRRALAFAFSGAVLLLVAAWFGLSWLLGSPPQAKPKPLDTTAQLELLKLVFALVAGVGALVALVTAYRRQRIDEAAGERAERIQAHTEHVARLTQAHAEQVAQAAAHDAVERRVTELYGQAVEQLGHDKAAVRLGGLYSLERLAQDHPTHRQTVTDVICAYLRMPYGLLLDAGPDTPLTEADTAARQELQVRLAAQRLLKRHLTAEPADRSGTYWADLTIDLTEAHLIDFDLSFCHIHSINLTKARFSGNAWFDGTQFSGEAWFPETRFSGEAGFSKTQFSKGADFREARFNGSARFDRARFGDAVLFIEVQFARYALFREVEFYGDARFDGVRVGEDAWFSEMQVRGETWFEEARVSGNARFGEARFNGDARFNEMRFGGDAEFEMAQFNENAWFNGAQFSGASGFGEVQFNGNTWFSRAQFAGNARFNRAEFEGEAGFGETRFGGDAEFSGARLSGNARFHEARFGGKTDFGRTSFQHPPVFEEATAHTGAESGWPEGWELEVPEDGEESMGRLVRRR